MIGGSPVSSNLVQEMKGKCFATTVTLLLIKDRVSTRGGAAIQDKTVTLRTFNVSAVIAATMTFVDHAIKGNRRLCLVPFKLVLNAAACVPSNT